MNVFPNKLVEVIFTAYCKARGMNPDDWPSIGLEKQNAWLAAANAARDVCDLRLDKPVNMATEYDGQDYG